MKSVVIYLVAAFVKLKATDPANLAEDPSRWAGTVMDYLGQIAALVGGAATETLYRASWYSSDVFPFIVIDWKPCGECWEGTFSQTSTITDSFNKTIGDTTTAHTMTKTTYKWDLERK